MKAGNPLNAFRGNYTQQDVMLEVRRRLRKYAPMRVGVRNAQSFNFGAGGRTDIDFVIRGPDIVALAGYADDLMDRSEKLGGIVDADTTLKLNKPELRVLIDRDRAADLGVSTSDIATSLRLMVGGEEEASRFRDESINEDYDVQLRLTEKDRSDAGTISRLYVPSSRGGQSRKDRAQHESFANRSSRSRAPGFTARFSGAGLRACRSHRGYAAGGQ
jgi:HAE1 family hydrophobic/amphiphilic exporter-1